MEVLLILEEACTKKKNNIGENWICGNITKDVKFTKVPKIGKGNTKNNVS